MGTQQDYFKLNRFFYTSAGSWSLDTSSWRSPTLGLIARVLHTIYRIFSSTLLSMFSILLSIATYFNMGIGFDDTFLAMLNAVIFIWNSLQFYYFWYTRRAIEDCYARMNKKLRYRSAPGLTYVTIDSGLALARKALFYWHCTTTMAAMSYNLIPILNRQRILPLPAWYPFDVYVG